MSTFSDSSFYREQPILIRLNRASPQSLKPMSGVEGLEGIRSQGPRV